MKILYLISSLDKGGAENHLADLVSEISREKKNKVFVLFLKGNNYWKDKLIKKGVTVQKVSLPNLLNIQFFLCLFKINYFIKTFQPDIVHAHLTSMELISAIIKFFNKKSFKLIISKHLDSFFLEGSFGQNFFLNGSFIDKFIFNHADHVICISQQVKKYFLKKMPKMSNKMSVIYYGFDIESFLKTRSKKKKFNLRKKNKIDSDKIVILNIARHVAQKNLEVLLKGFKLYSDTIPSKLIMVGQGPRTKNLKKIAEELKINSKIVWIKYYENVIDLYQIADIFVLSSKYEGLGLVLLESMASEVPVVASKVSAIPEVVKHNFSGVLFDYNNEKNLAASLKKINNTNLKKKIISNAHKLILNKFSLNKMIKKTKQIYSKVLIN